MVIGSSLWIAVGLIARAGLANGAGGSDKEDELAALVIPRGHVNISGLKRLMRRQDPAWRPGDVTADYRQMGIVGLALGVAATGNDMARQAAIAAGRPYDQERVPLADLVAGGALALPSALMEMSMLKGTSTILSAIAERRQFVLLDQWASAISGIAAPNSLAQLGRLFMQTQPETRTIPEGFGMGDKANAAARQAINEWQVRTYLWRALARKGVGPTPQEMGMPARLDMFGRPVPATPPGRGAPAYNLLDVSRARAIPYDAITAELDAVYRATGDRDVLPGGKTRTVTDPDTGMPERLTEEEAARLLELRGALLRGIIGAALERQDYTGTAPADRAPALKMMTSAATSAGLKILRVERLTGRRANLP